MSTKTHFNLKAILLTICSIAAFTSFAQKSWVKISSGVEFSVGLKSDGTIWAWGNNANGQLGIGNTTSKTLPVQIGTDTDWKTIDAGSFHVLAIKNNGTLWSWGFNSYGQIGNGTTTTDAHSPVQIGTDTNWAKVSAGFAQSFAIKSDSTLWAWGYNQYSTLGINPADASIPNQVMPGSKWSDCSSGCVHTIAIQADSTLWGWGFNATGQVGNGTTTQQDTPVKIDSIQKWISASAGFEFSMGLTDAHQIYSWGWNGNGQLGTGNGQTLLVPTVVSPTLHFIQIAAGSSYAFGITEENSLYGWGYNGRGQLGNGATTSLTAPAQIGSDTDWKFINAAKGTNYQGQIYGFHSAGLKLTGFDRCFSGANYISQLGNGNTVEIHDFTCYDDNLGIDELNNAAFSVYPNPATNLLAISLDAQQQAQEVELISLQGTVLRKVKLVPGTNHLDVSTLDAGIYFLKNSGSTVQFIKQ